jgi:nicotinamide-nucleotide amidase
MLFDNKANSIGQYLLGRHETVAVAESVTAGYIQALLSSAAQAFLFFQGGITTYNIGQKVKHLQVDPEEAERTNCVSELVAIQMSQGVQHLFNSDYGVAVTGYAAPLPEKGIQDIYAFVAISYRRQLLLTERITSTQQASAAVQVDYAEQVIRIFEQSLTSS